MGMLRDSQDRPICWYLCQAFQNQRDAISASKLGPVGVLEIRKIGVSLFGIIRRDPETVLVPPTTTQIPGRIIRTGTEGLRLFRLLLTVRAQSVTPCAVTQSRRPHFPNPYLIWNRVTNTVPSEL